MFISPVPRGARPAGQGRRLCSGRTMIMIGGVAILVVWIFAASIFIANNKDYEYLSLKNSKLRDRARWKTPQHRAPSSILAAPPVTEDTTITEQETGDKNHPDWWASDSHLDASTKHKREAVKQVRQYLAANPVPC